MKKHLIVTIIAIIAILITLLCACSQESTEEAPFIFLFMADTQADPETGDYSGLSSIFDVAINGEPKPELLILGGDTVNDGRDENEWAAFHLAASTLLDTIPAAAAAGNHDNSPLLTRQFTWPETEMRGYFYSFNMSGVHFTILDSNYMGAANDEDIAWLYEDLKSASATEADWRVAVCHHPFWPVAGIPRDIIRAETMREHFLPLLAEHGVDLLLVGHQHAYARSVPPTGPVQIMAATGDKASYLPDNYDYIAMTAHAPNYIKVSANAETLEITAFNLAGEVIDSFTLLN